MKILIYIILIILFTSCKNENFSRKNDDLSLKLEHKLGFHFTIKFKNESQNEITVFHVKQESFDNRIGFSGIWMRIDPLERVNERFIFAPPRPDRINESDLIILQPNESYISLIDVEHAKYVNSTRHKEVHGYAIQKSLNESTGLHSVMVFFSVSADHSLPAKYSNNGWFGSISSNEVIVDFHASQMD